MTEQRISSSSMEMQPTSGDAPPAVGSSSTLERQSPVVGRIECVPLNSLVPGKSRRAGDSEVGDLMESLTHAPQLQNIVVRPLEGHADKYEIISGHRRVDALRALGETHVEAKVFEADDETAELYGLEENLRRRALADEPSALARTKALYLAKGAGGRGGARRGTASDSSGHDGRLPESATTMVAELAGVSERTARRMVKIGNQGDPALQQALKDGRISLNEAEKLAGLPPDEQRRRVAELAVLGKRVDAPTSLLRAEKAVSRLVKQVASFRKEVGGATLQKQDVVSLKNAATALAKEVEQLEAECTSPAPQDAKAEDEGGAGSAGPEGGARPPDPPHPLDSGNGGSDGQ